MVRMLGLKAKKCFEGSKHGFKFYSLIIFCCFLEEYLQKKKRMMMMMMKMKMVLMKWKTRINSMLVHFLM